MAGDNAGFSVSGAGDVNGDGIDDLLVGASNGSDGGIAAGEAYVIYGQTGATRTVVDLTGLTASDGFILQGDEARDKAGYSVSGAGDVNGDGIDDLIVGAPPGDDGGSYAGEAYVIYGQIGSTRATLDLTGLASSDGFIIQGDVVGDNAGHSVSGAGDVNGDGIADMIVGAPFGDDGGDAAGEAYVIYGQTGVTRTTVDLTGLAASDGFIIQGDAAFDQAGLSVSGAGDVNGDGIDDLIVGAQRGDDGGSDAGEAYVIYGQAGSTRTTLDLTGLAPSDGFIIQGSTNDLAGNSVSAAGDVNNDGFDDLIIGALLGDDGGSAAGEGYVIYGFATPTVIDVTGLSADQGFIIQGDAAFDEAAYSVSGAGDVNGDGIDDMIVGARFGDDGGFNAGEAYVIYGQAGSSRGVVDLSFLAPSLGFIIQGESVGDFAGKNVSSAGDINGDGIDDLIVGADGNDAGGGYAGAAYVIYGQAGSTRTTLDLNGLTASDGFKIQGDATSDYVGRSVSGAGDVNGDGIDDLIVGANDGDNGGNNAGEAYVIYGQAGATRTTLDLTGLTSTDGFIIQGDAPFDSAGWSVSAAGDVNNDGIDDVIVGARAGDDGGTEAGEAYVIYGEVGASRSTVDLSGLLPGLANADGFIIQGDSAGDLLGATVSGAGDVNGDGIDDVIVGAPLGDDGGVDTGEAYVIYGQDSATRVSIDLTGLSASDGFIIQGDETDDQAGTSVSAAGDVNGDGIGDMIVGAVLGDDGGTNAGEAYVIYGQVGSTRTTLDLSEITSSDGFIIQGDRVNDFLGRSVSAAGDVNNDGFDDLIVGAPFGDKGGTTAGEAFVIYGFGNAPAASGLPVRAEVAEDTATTLDLTALVLRDVDPTGTMTLTLSAGVGTLTAAAGSGIVATLSDGDRTLTLVGTLADLNTYFQISDTIQYTGPQDANGVDSDAIAVTINDDDGMGDVVVGDIPIDITPVNDAPTATGLPGTATMIEDVPGALDLSNLVLSDVDATRTMTLTLTATAGTLAGAPATGITVTPSNGDQTLTLTGTLASLNAYLINPAVISYTGAPDANGIGADSVALTLNDGEGSGDIALGSVTIDITPVTDQVDGTGLDDALVATSQAEAFFGYGGTDSVSYAAAPGRIRIDLQNPANNTGDATGDTFDSIETLIGTAFNDILRGDGDDNTLIGGADSDKLYGRGGNDVLEGGADADELYGSSGTDTASYAGAAAGVEADLETPGGNTGDAAGDIYDSIENLTGSGFVDALRGDSGVNLLAGGDGDDLLAGRDNDDVLDGGAGGDDLRGGAGKDTASYASATGGVRADLQTPGGNTGDAAGDTYDSIENLTGSDFGDVMRGDGANNVLLGGAGADRLFGRSGDDTITGGAGRDSMKGQGGADVFVFDTGAGLDTIGDWEDGVDLIDFGGIAAVGDFGDLFVFNTGGPVSAVLYVDDAGALNGVIVAAGGATLDAGDFVF